MYTSSDTAKMGDLLSAMAIGWVPSLARAVGFKPLNDVLKYARHDVLGAPKYRLFAGTIAHASDEQIPRTHAMVDSAPTSDPISPFRSD